MIGRGTQMTSDIFSFINSRDIRSHLEEIGYRFSSIEAAWIIWQSMDRTWVEKKKAWTELIHVMPDCEIPERFNCKYRESLHRYLEEYMDVVDRQYSECIKHVPDGVYSYRIHFYGDEDWVQDYGSVYTVYGKCLDEALRTVSELSADREEKAEIEIRKQFFKDTKQEYKVCLDQDGNLMDIRKTVLTEKEQDILCDSFGGLWFSFSVPFKKGDIVIERRDQRYPGHTFTGGPFVLTHIASWDKNHRKEVGDNTDMIAGGHFLNEDGTVFDEVTDNYMNCEYYRGSFDGVRRLLKTISSFEKGEIGLMLLLTAYRHILLDYASDDVLLQWFTKEGLTMAGLDDIDTRG